MIDVMTDETGRRWIAELVQYEVSRLGLTRTRMRKQWGSVVSPATVDRVRRGEVVGDSYLAAIGDLLGMPRGFLTYVGEGDVARIKTSGADPDLIRWVLDLLDAESAAG
jgi:hypothetical protein